MPVLDSAVDQELKCRRNEPDTRYKSERWRNRILLGRTDGITNLNDLNCYPRLRTGMQPAD